MNQHLKLPQLGTKKPFPKNLRIGKGGYYLELMNQHLKAIVISNIIYLNQYAFTVLVIAQDTAQLTQDSIPALVLTQQLIYKPLHII